MIRTPSSLSASIRVEFDASINMKMIAKTIAVTGFTAVS